MPHFDAERPELMARFRSAFAQRQSTLSASAALSHEGGYAPAEEVENTAGGGKPIGARAKVL